MAPLHPSVPCSDLTLWTGGWDSTFRVLQRALVEEISVRPGYMVEWVRPSAGKELDTMNGLRKMLIEQRPDVAARIEPPRYVDRAAIPEDDAITDAWEHLTERYDIGRQYERLARLLDAADWTGVELSVYGGGRLRPMFGEHIQPTTTTDGRRTHALTHDAPEPLRLVFGRYAFPFWELEKREAFALADKQGLTKLLNAHTWFCHNPVNGKACGQCRPCRFVVKDGLGHRIPTSGHVRHTVAEARMKLGLRTRIRKLF